VPAIASGTWRAAGNVFRKPVRVPRSVPMQSFNRMASSQIGANGITGGVIGAGGAATVAVSPQGYGTRWYPNQAGIATASGAADSSTCTLYLNVIAAGGFLAQSYAGGGDQLGLAVPAMQPGDILYAVWSGGHAGDWCQLQVIGPMDVLIA
jgi:hypothetical protein